MFSQFVLSRKGLAWATSHWQPQVRILHLFSRSTTVPASQELHPCDPFTYLPVYIPDPTIIKISINATSFD
jgi:hypothetical protein